MKAFETQISVRTPNQKNKLQDTWNSKQTDYFDLTGAEGNGTFLSVSLLRHSQTKISFTKSTRFNKIKDLSSTSTLYLPCQLSNRKTNLGYGKKSIFPNYHQNNAKQFPSPDRYNTDSDISRQHTGKTFGLPLSLQVYAPHKRDYVSLDVAANIPGVGKYDVQKNIGSDKSKYTLRIKGDLDKADKSNPGANHYFINNSQTLTTRFEKRGIGYGNKYDFTKNVNNFPSPAQYRLPSQFDKFEKKSLIEQKIKKYRIQRAINQNRFKTNGLNDHIPEQNETDQQFDDNK